MTLKNTPTQYGWVSRALLSGLLISTAGGHPSHFFDKDTILRRML